ncbi:response regulator [Maribellus sediminis]|uniref:hybrid sensor histidine kinase/response regulator transcription factor n=1 Tax=Maribellus sediminis TaxID=2696285 RepID=UPI00142F7833|nr:response regulator [Maribellus sediminis]
MDSLFQNYEKEKDDSIRFKIQHEIDIALSELDKDTMLSILANLAQFSEENEYSGNAALSYYLIGRELRKSGEYIGSFEAYNKSEGYFELLKDTKGLAQVYNGLGSLFKNLNNYEESYNQYVHSLQLYEELKDSSWIGSICLNIGGMFEEEGKLDSALLYLKKSQKVLKLVDEKNSLLNCYINLGIVFEKDNKPDSAFKYFVESYDLASIDENPRAKFNVSFYLGKFLLDQNSIPAAETYLEEARQIANGYENKNLLAEGDLASFNIVLSHYYATIKDFEKAYFYLRKSIDYDTEEKIDVARREYNKMEFKLAEQEAIRKQKSRETLIAVAVAIIFLTLILLVAIYRSYKHKQKANRLLTEMDDLKTKLFSNISHELRTPLTLILAPLEQMLSKEAEKAPSRKQIKQMRKNANAILELVNQMLDLSKIDAKSMKQELVNSDIVSFIRAHFAAFSTLAKQKDISFNSYTPPDKKLRLFDASKLEKIINNLVSNALKYTPEGGQVFCFANFPKPNLLELIIQDTGKGIQPEELSRIFDRFHQVSNSTSQQNIGTGIGLSLTKELVELMYGQISVESIVGEGSKFKVSLPLGKEHLQNDEYVILENYSAQSAPVFTDDEETPNCNESPEASRENLPELLIVEDHPEISEFIRENLHACYHVETAANGKLGFEMATEQIPDLIISDVMMPEMDGIEMSRKIKADERTSHIPIILLTGKASHADKMQGLETGVDAFVPKPFNMKELRLRIEKIIEQRQKLRERFNKNLKLEPKDIAVSSADEKFIDKVMELIEKNMSNTEFEVNQLQDELLMSRTQLFRKIKALTNQSPGEFIRTIRLKRAASLLDQKFGNIAQITYEVGFNNPSYFAKCFKELFGMLPSEYMKKE